VKLIKIPQSIDDELSITVATEVLLVQPELPDKSEYFLKRKKNIFTIELV